MWKPPINAFKRIDNKENVRHKANINKEGKQQLNEFINEIESYKGNRKGNIDIKKYRKIKSLNIYRLAKIGGTVVKQFKRIKFSEFGSCSNIKVDNRVVGVTPNYIGFRKSKPVHFDNIILKQIQKKFSSILTSNQTVKPDLIKSLSTFREVFSGSPDSNSKHLRSFLGDNNNEESVVDIINIALKSDWFEVPEIDFSDYTDLPYVTNYNPKSSPGLYTSRIFQTKFKANTIDPSVVLAMEKMRLIRKFPVKNFSLWEVLSREKDFKTDELKEGTEVSTRVVLNCEHYETVLLSYFFQKIMKSLSSFSTHSKFNIEGEFNGKKSFNLINKLYEYDYIVDADWAAFDSSMDTNEIIASAAIMFSNCVNTKEDMRAIFHVISSLVTKYVAVPPGVVVELNRGMPSGHAGGTAINCFVNILRWSRIGYKLFGDDFPKFMDIHVYGDDALVFFKAHERIKDIDNVINSLNFKSDPIFPNIYPCKEYLAGKDEGPDFLKRRFSIKGITWNKVKMFDRMIYQQKKRTIDEQFELVLSYIMSAPSDGSVNTFLSEMLHDLIELYPNEITSDNKKNFTSLEDWIKNNSKYFIPSSKSFSDFDEYESSVKKVNVQMTLDTFKKVFLSIRNIQYIDKNMAEALLFLSENTGLIEIYNKIYKQKYPGLFKHVYTWKSKFIEFRNFDKVISSMFKYFDTG